MSTQQRRIARATAPGALLALMLLAGTAGAAGTPPSPPTSSSEPSEPPLSQEQEQAPDSTKVRSDAEKLYAKGYDIAQDAKKDLAAGKTDSAKKKFGKALKKFQDAAQLDPKYYQAWNMIGYCSRKTGNLDAAFAAYQTCLSINPDYEEAHEYLGEAYVQSGDLAKAKEQLAWLDARKSDEGKDLKESIDAAEAKAGTVAPASTAAPASAASSAAPDSSSH